MNPAQISDLLYKQSGLLGVSGSSSDMRTLLQKDDTAARRAIDLFCLYAARELAGLAVAIGGVDALVFTAGIGENNASIRANIIGQLAWLGILIDSDANEAHGPCISVTESPISVWVIPTDEETMLAAHAKNLSKMLVR